jgi:Phosphotransferase enzyme family
MALPRCRPMSKNKLVLAWQRTAVRPLALRWLRGLVDLAEPASTQAADKFVAALHHLAGRDVLPHDIRSAAKASIAKISAKEANPCFVPMHGDFGLENILTSKNTPLVVIDWRGSLVQGFPIYDLIRLAGSLNLPPALLRAELAYHAKSLEASEQDTRIFLLAALGHFSANLGEFPVDRFRALAIETFSVLGAALAD